MHKFLRLKEIVECKDYGKKVNGKKIIGYSSANREYKLDDGTTAPEDSVVTEQLSCPSCGCVNISTEGSTCTCQRCGKVWECDASDTDESFKNNESSTVAGIVSGVVLRYGYKVIDQIADASSTILTINSDVSTDEQSEMMEDIERITSSDVSFLGSNQIKIIG